MFQQLRALIASWLWFRFTRHEIHGILAFFIMTSSTFARRFLSWVFVYIGTIQQGNTIMSHKRKSPCNGSPFARSPTKTAKASTDYVFFISQHIELTADHCCFYQQDDKKATEEEPSSTLVETDDASLCCAQPREENEQEDLVKLLQQTMDLDTQQPTQPTGPDNTPRTGGVALRSSQSTAAAGTVDIIQWHWSNDFAGTDSSRCESPILVPHHEDAKASLSQCAELQQTLELRDKQLAELRAENASLYSLMQQHGSLRHKYEESALQKEKIEQTLRCVRLELISSRQELTSTIAALRKEREEHTRTATALERERTKVNDLKSGLSGLQATMGKLLGEPIVVDSQIDC